MEMEITGDAPDGKQQDLPKSELNVSVSYATVLSIVALTFLDIKSKSQSCPEVRDEVTLL